MTGTVRSTVSGATAEECDAAIAAYLHSFHPLGYGTRITINTKYNPERKIYTAVLERQASCD